MIKIYLMKKFSKILESERSKYFKKGMNHGHKKAGLDFQKQIRAVEKKHKKEIAEERHQGAIGLQQAEKFFADMNERLLKIGS